MPLCMRVLHQAKVDLVKMIKIKARVAGRSTAATPTPPRRVCVLCAMWHIYLSSNVHTGRSLIFFASSLSSLHFRWSIFSRGKLPAFLPYLVCTSFVPHRTTAYSSTRLSLSQQDLSGTSTSLLTATYLSYPGQSSS